MARKKKVEEEVKEESAPEVPKEVEIPIKEETQPIKVEIPVEEKPKSSHKTKEILLFNRWSFDGIEVKDISLKNYVNLTPIIIPHSGGKHQHKKFWKTEHISIVERFINKMLAPGLLGKRIKGRGSSHNSGKKQKMLKVVYNAFAIIETKTGNNPIQVLIKSIENAAPREETTRISLGGISYQQAVDISPQRRIDLALKIIVQSFIGSAYGNIKTIDELMAEELINCSRNEGKSKAIKRKDELERVAISAR